MGDRFWNTGLGDSLSHTLMDIPIKSFNFNKLLVFSNNEHLSGNLAASSRSQSEWPWDTSIEGKAEEQRHLLLQLSLTPRRSQPPAPLLQSPSRRPPSLRRAALAQFQGRCSRPVPSAGPGWQHPQRGHSAASDTLHVLPAGRGLGPASHRTRCPCCYTRCGLHQDG